jgi:hypothetical protein
MACDSGATTDTGSSSMEAAAGAVIAHTCRYAREEYEEGEEAAGKGAGLLPTVQVRTANLSCCGCGIREGERRSVGSVSGRRREGRETQNSKKSDRKLVYHVPDTVDMTATRLVAPLDQHPSCSELGGFPTRLLTATKKGGEGITSSSSHYWIWGAGRV